MRKEPKKCEGHQPLLVAIALMLSHQVLKMVARCSKRSSSALLFNICHVSNCDQHCICFGRCRCATSFLARPSTSTGLRKETNETCLQEIGKGVGSRSCNCHGCGLYSLHLHNKTRQIRDAREDASKTGTQQLLHNQMTSFCVSWSLELLDWRTIPAMRQSMRKALAGARRRLQSQVFRPA